MDREHRGLVYIDLSLLARVNAAVENGTAPDLASWNPSAASNSFTGTTVQTIVLEVEHGASGLRIGEAIGVWAATKLTTAPVTGGRSTARDIR